MAKRVDRGQLRIIAINTFSVISGDVRSSQKLCDAGDAVYFGRFLRKNVPDLHEK